MAPSLIHPPDMSSSAGLDACFPQCFDICAVRKPSAQFAFTYTRPDRFGYTYPPSRSATCFSEPTSDYYIRHDDWQSKLMCLHLTGTIQKSRLVSSLPYAPVEFLRCAHFCSRFWMKSVHILCPLDGTNDEPGVSSLLPQLRSTNGSCVQNTSDSGL